MDREAIFDVMRPIIMSVTKVPECILAYGNIEAPPGPYAVVEPKRNITERGQANVEYRTGTADKTVDTDVRAQLIADCSVQFYRDGALDFATKLKQMDKRPEVAIDLFKAGLGLNRTGPVNNLTSLQADNFEQRSQISLYLMYEEVDDVTVNSIESVSVAVENEKGKTLVTVDLDVNT